MNALLLALALTGAPFSSNTPNTLKAQQGPVYSVKDIGAFDSLAPRSIADRYWHTITSAAQTPPFAMGAVAPNATSSFLDAVEMNHEGIVAASAQFYSIAPFSTPAGITSVTMSVTMSAGGVDNGKSAFGFINTGFGAVVGSLTAQQPSGAMVTYTNTQTVTASTNYWAFFAQNQAGYGCTGTVNDPIVGDVQVKPVGGSGFWASDFYRVGADARTLSYNTRDEYAGDGSFNPSPSSSLKGTTDATTLAIEFETTTTASTSISPVLLINGRYFGKAIPTLVNVREFATFTDLPAGMKSFQVVSASDTDPGAFGSHVGSRLQAVYFPANSTSFVDGPSFGGRTLVIYGDSIIAGQGGGVPVFLAQGMPVLLRQQFPGSVYVEAWGSRQLARDITAATVVSQAHLAQIVNYIARAQPTDVWLQIGFNDYANATLTKAQFGVAEGALCDALHARLPTANIYLQTLGSTGLEGTPNGNGDTPPNFRTVQTALGTGRPWMTVVDGTTLYASTDLADTAHLKLGAQSTFMQSILTNINAQAGAGSLSAQTFAPTLVIGAGGTAITKSLLGTAISSPSAVAGNVCGANSITMTGVVTGANCSPVLPAGWAQNLAAYCFVSAADTAKLEFCNPTAGSITPTTASSQYNCRCENP